MFTTRPMKIALTCLALSMPVLAHADAAGDAAAKDLIATTQLDNVLTQVSQQAAGSAVPLLQEYFVKNKITLSADQQKKVQAGLKDYVGRQQKLAADYFGSAAVRQQFEASLTKAYAAQFTTDEIKQLVAFYKTTAGQKILKQQGQIINNVVGETLKTADASLLQKMQAEAASYGKTFAKAKK